MQFVPRLPQATFIQTGPRLARGRVEGEVSVRQFMQSMSVDWLKWI